MSAHVPSTLSDMLKSPNCSGEGEICTPKSDSDPIVSWKCHAEKAEKPEKPEKPEPVVCVNDDGTYYQGPKSAFPDVQQRYVRNGSCTTQIVCKGISLETFGLYCGQDTLNPAIEECFCGGSIATGPEP